MNIKTINKTHSSRLPNGNNVERVIIPLTKANNPCYWESGGGMTNTGRATIVTDRLYQKLNPLYVKRGGNLANSNHAMLPLRKGFKIIHVKLFRGDYDVKIFEVKSIRSDVATLELIADFSAETERDWEGGLAGDAIKAGIAKANDYHCKVPHYIRK